MENKPYELKISDVFKRLVQPMTDNKFRCLEKKISHKKHAKKQCAYKTYRNTHKNKKRRGVQILLYHFLSMIWLEISIILFLT